MRLAWPPATRLRFVAEGLDYRIAGGRRRGFKESAGPTGEATGRQEKEIARLTVNWRTRISSPRPRRGADRSSGSLTESAARSNDAGQQRAAVSRSAWGLTWPSSCRRDPARRSACVGRRRRPRRRHDNGPFSQSGTRCGPDHCPTGPHGRRAGRRRSGLSRCGCIARLDGRCRKGSRAAAGETLLRIEGDGRSILKAERVALNFLQHLSGIATLTGRFFRPFAVTRSRSSTHERPSRAGGRSKNGR